MLWYIGLLFGTLFLILSIIICIKERHTTSDEGVMVILVSIFVLIVSVVVILLSGGTGINNYAQIPRIHRDICLEETNKDHYHTAMEYNFGDESNERKTASHVRWFKDGDFSESKDNKTWKQNYDDWFYNKSLITYHKMQLKYYTHPIHNWRDGLSMPALYNSINKPANENN